MILQTPVTELFAGHAEEVQHEVEKRARRLARKLARVANDPCAMRKRESVRRILLEE